MPPTVPEQFAPSVVNNRTTAVLLDLDGTLVDTAPDIHEAAVAVLAELGLPALSFSETRSFIGDGMPRFIKRLLTRQWWGEPDADLFAEAERLMKRHYGRLCTASLKVYEGVRDTLDALRTQGMGLACVTNKPQTFTEPLLSACGLRDYFDTVVAGDSLSHKKPHPLPLLTAVEALGGSPENALMVGDSNADADAAQAANIRFVVVSYGYHRNRTLPAASAVIGRFPELLDCL